MVFQKKITGDILSSILVQNGTIQSDLLLVVHEIRHNDISGLYGYVYFKAVNFEIYYCLAKC